MLVTYSKNAFFPLTTTCRNECTYCNFKKNDFKLMNFNEVLKLAKVASNNNCSEALLTFGERPDVYREFRKNMKKLGYSCFIDYVASVCTFCIESGLIPHTNAGVLLTKELKKLKPLNGSMGLMLEQAVELECHINSPGKDPKVRIKTIERAGKLEIPFTTGILLGIGESEYDRLYSLEVLADINNNYNHIQEIIVQPLVLRGRRMVKFEEIKKIVKVASKMFNHVQIPPNLFSLGEVLALIKAGANDLGGISPITPDYVNPNNPWPSISKLKLFLAENGVKLVERLPVYDEFISRGVYGKMTEKLVLRRGLK